MGKTVKLIIAILLCEGIGILSGLLGSVSNNPWFDQLKKPSFYPPGYIFGPVWTAIYLLMGIALWIVWTRETDLSKRRSASFLFGLQLLFNFFWSVIFFRYHSPGWALVDIVLLFLALLLTIVQFAKTSKLAAWLLVPYIAWVSFASILNYTIWKIN